MIRHHITKYGRDGKWYAIAWLQINILWWSFCFWQREIEL